MRWVSCPLHCYLFLFPCISSSGGISTVFRRPLHLARAAAPAGPGRQAWAGRGGGAAGSACRGRLSNKHVTRPLSNSARSALQVQLRNGCVGKADAPSSPGRYALHDPPKSFKPVKRLSTRKPQLPLYPFGRCRQNRCFPFCECKIILKLMFFVSKFKSVKL